MYIEGGTRGHRPFDLRNCDVQSDVPPLVTTVAAHYRTGRLYLVMLNAANPEEQLNLNRRQVHVYGISKEYQQGLSRRDQPETPSFKFPTGNVKMVEVVLYYDRSFGWLRCVDEVRLMSIGPYNIARHNDVIDLTSRHRPTDEEVTMRAPSVSEVLPGPSTPAILPPSSEPASGRAVGMVSPNNVFDLTVSTLLNTSNIPHTVKTTTGVFGQKVTPAPVTYNYGSGRFTPVESTSGVIIAEMESDSEPETIDIASPLKRDAYARAVKSPSNFPTVSEAGNSSGTRAEANTGKSPTDPAKRFSRGGKRSKPFFWNNWNEGNPNQPSSYHGFVLTCQ